VLTKLLDLVYRLDKQKLQQFLVASQGRRELAALRGYLFEEFGHRALRESNLKCSVRQLMEPDEEVSGGPSKRRRVDAGLESAAEHADGQQQPQQEEEEEDEDHVLPHHCCAVTPEALEQEHMQTEVSEQQQGLEREDTWPLTGPLQHKWDSPELVLADLQDTYLQPYSTNNAAWDAVRCSAKPLILQYTVSLQHGVKAEPIRVLLERFSEEQRKAARLVFVVPPEVFPYFKWQPWLAAGGGRMQKIPQVLKGLTQWVMALKMEVPSPRSSDEGGDGHGS
jgi:hypothetical protein